MTRVVNVREEEIAIDKYAAISLELDDNANR